MVLNGDQCLPRSFMLLSGRKPITADRFNISELSQGEAQYSCSLCILTSHICHCIQIIPSTTANISWAQDIRWNVWGEMSFLHRNAIKCLHWKTMKQREIPRFYNLLLAVNLKVGFIYFIICCLIQILFYCTFLWSTLLQTITIISVWSCYIFV